MKILILVGTRPNFIKVTRFKKVCKQRHPHIRIEIVHTGQHYDEKMADVFFRQFDLLPDHFLNIKAGTPNQQIAEIIVKLEELCDKIGKPNWMLVPGDVNSTMAGAIFANKAGIKLGHIEAGLRSYDRSMPEEFNRIVTDQLSDLFFVTEQSGYDHLLKEGYPESKIHFVGNTMIDTMVDFALAIDKSQILDELSVANQEFVLMTMHRPATVDNKEELSKLFDLIDHLIVRYKIIFPIHPRTIKNIQLFGLNERLEKAKGLICTDPLDYFSFQKLIKECSFIVTDSGGIQEESTFVGKPCLTLRPNTERPVTIDVGSNTLLPFDLELLKEMIQKIEDGRYKKGSVPKMWDGRATERILDVISTN